MLKGCKGFVAGFLSCAVLAAGIGSVLAYTDWVEVEYDGIRLVVDGEKITPRDPNGAVVDPFVIDGTTYLPVRAVAEALGEAVTWDGNTNTVYIGNADGLLTRPSLRMEDAVNIGATQFKTLTDNPKDNYGNVYGSAMFTTYHPGTFETLLNGKYKRFKGTVYVKFGETAVKTSSFEIQGDGKTIYSSPSINKKSKPLSLDVDVTDVNDFKIVIDSNTTDNITVYFADCGFYQ